jgi:hypothetical protein
MQVNAPIVINIAENGSIAQTNVSGRRCQNCGDTYDSSEDDPESDKLILFLIHTTDGILTFTQNPDVQ